MGIQKHIPKQMGALEPGPARPSTHTSHEQVLTPDLLLDFLGGVQPILEEN